jgi:hypothetical protein
LVGNTKKKKKKKKKGLDNLYEAFLNLFLQVDMKYSKYLSIKDKR